ncbi:MAG: ATP-dependent Clp protease ATP-binding subunit ClpX, partial [SAR202 cluster bacterium]|nr:ATP-dependent Clp protease ATP-binding subunit ClpX [SAR202 cluster bacterium]
TARESLQNKTGARGLRSVVENILLDVMYDLPSLKEVRRCIVDGDTINNHKRPILLTAAGSVVEPRPERQSA